MIDNFVRRNEVSGQFLYIYVKNAHKKRLVIEAFFCYNMIIM